MHQLHEAGQLVGESAGSEDENASPPPSPPPPSVYKCTGGQGLPPVCVPLPVGPLFEFRGKGKEAFDVFSLLIDSSAALRPGTEDARRLYFLRVPPTDL